MADTVNGPKLLCLELAIEVHTHDDGVDPTAITKTAEHFRTYLCSGGDAGAKPNVRPIGSVTKLRPVS